MKKNRLIRLRHLFDSLDSPRRSDGFYHVQLFCDYKQWIKFKICCYFQAIEPMDALNNYVKSASPDQIVEYARKYMGGKKG